MLVKDSSPNYEIRYELTSKLIHVDNIGEIRAWGILGYTREPVYSNIIHMIHIDNISDNCSTTVKIITLLRENNVCLSHMSEIVEDCLICGI